MMFGQCITSKQAHPHMNDGDFQRTATPMLVRAIFEAIHNQRTDNKIA